MIIGENPLYSLKDARAPVPLTILEVLILNTYVLRGPKVCSNLLCYSFLYGWIRTGRECRLCFIT